MNAVTARLCSVARQPYIAASAAPAPSPTPQAPSGPLGTFLTDPLAALHGWCDQILEAVAAHARLVTAAALITVLAVTFARRMAARWRHSRLAGHARIVEILPPPSADMAGAEAMWSQLLGLLRPSWLRLLTGTPHVSWEQIFTADGVRFRLWVPGVVPPGLVERAVAGAWPGAQTRTQSADQRIAPFGHGARGGRLVLARPDHFPLRTGFDADPLRGVLAAAGHLAIGEIMAVQVLARPATGRRLRKAARYATALRHGTSTGVKSAIFDFITPGQTATAHSRPATSLSAEVPANVRAILGKAARPRFDTEIRYLVAVPSIGRQSRAWLRGRAHALAAAFSVFTAENHLRRRRLRRPAETMGARRMKRGTLLSVPELAALCHLPVDETVPGLTRASARPAAPPPAIPSTGPDVRLLGDSEAGQVRPVAVCVADARQHTHLLGGTGTGKSTQIATMQLDDAKAGRAFCSIEAKGDSTQILPRLPASCVGKVVVIDPADRGPVPCVNVLDCPDRELTADTVVGIFRRIYADFWGPRTDDVLRSAILTATTRPGATLADIPVLLTDDTHRARVTAGLDNRFLVDFWRWYDTLSPAQRGQVTGPLMNKLRAVLLRGFARDVLAGGTSTVDIPKLLDGGGILLARLPKGILGEDTARLLGSMILAKIWQAVQARAAVPEHLRKDCAIYVDEAHNFLTLPHGIDDMLAEARSHRAALVIAHQNLAQLPRELREAVSANARNKIYFAVSPEDARALQRHVHPNLTEHDLSHLSAFQAAVRLVNHGEITPSFTLRTRPLPPPIKGRERAVRKASQLAFGVRDHPATQVTRPATALEPRLRA
jgi:hypothetical protein